MLGVSVRLGSGRQHALLLAALFGGLACGRFGFSSVDRGTDAGRHPDPPPVDAGPRQGDGGPVVEPDAGPGDAGKADAGHDAGSDAGHDTGNDGGRDAAAPADLVLRYDFAGTGTVVTDLIGAGHAQVFGGAQLDGSGELTLDGADDFVDLPNGLVSNLTSATVMAWLTSTRDDCWPRIFDFGNNTGGEGNVGNATSSLSVTAKACGEAVLTALFEHRGSITAAHGVAIDQGTQTYVALVFDGMQQTITLYVDSAQVAQVATTRLLADVEDVNAWLGRSQWMQDPLLQGRYDEFRIYARALSTAEINGAFTRGPNAP